MISGIKTNKHREICDWAKSFRGFEIRLDPDFTLSELRNAFEPALRNYFALCGLSRHKTALRDLAQNAWDYVFQVRTAIERSIASSIWRTLSGGFEIVPPGLFSSWFYGASKKQGLSVRMPLTSCMPSRLCSAACYAHDALDASINAIIRGSLNGLIAELYEHGGNDVRRMIMFQLKRHSQRAVLEARRECRSVQPTWSRQPRIRFAPVGDVTCVIYTRHFKARELDPELWVVNFTLDSSSEDRIKWAPSRSRIVYSAFGGLISKKADINFLEHHPWLHFHPVGEGEICPVTLPETKIRKCDALRCDRCFRPVESLGDGVDQA
jgi:hypothetical protein